MLARLQTILTSSTSRAVLPAAIIAAIASGCGPDPKPDPDPDPDPQPEPTIAELVASAPDLAILHGALTTSGLAETLDEPGSLTLLAPTDEAFEVFLASQGWSADDLRVEPDLRDMLAYHVADAVLTADDLRTRDAVTSLEGRDITLVRTGADVLLDDLALVTLEAEEAANGVIYRIDAVLARRTTTEYRSEPHRPIAEQEYTEESIEITDEGYVRDIEVVLDIDHDFVLDLYLWLRNEETGEMLPLIAQPFSGLDDIKVTLSDSAPFDAQDDVAVGFEEGDAYPEERYRPLIPLRFAYGRPMAGSWTLVAYDWRTDDIGWINEWGLNVTWTEESPDPALALVPPRGASGVLARRFQETIPVQLGRLAGLEGPVELSIDAGEGVVSEATTAGIGRDAADLPIAASADAALGERSIVITATAGRARRSFTMPGRVVEPDARGVDLLAHLPLRALGAAGERGNDIWGWTDPVTGTEYALVGTSIGTAFVELSDPAAPVFLGMLPTHTDPSDWRDIKVFEDHAFVVSEAAGHGMQVFDLTQLRDVEAPVIFEATTHFGAFGNAHNVVINEDTGFAYVVGATEPDHGTVCAGGLLMIDIRTPTEPAFAGCFAGDVPVGAEPGPDFPLDVYTHDAQCVVYQGPDADHTGREICATSDGQINAGSADYFGLVDVTDKAAPVQLARLAYEGGGYAHQGWLTEDHRYFLLNDEEDEFWGVNTRTYIFDVSDLDDPYLLGTFDNPRDAVGHNTYIRDGQAFQSNYTSGLRILDLAGIESGALDEVAYFDTYPSDDDDDDGVPQPLSRRARCQASGEKIPPTTRLPRHPGGVRACGVATFQGAWSNYPFFDSGIIVISDINRGLFVVRPTAP